MQYLRRTDDAGQLYYNPVVKIIVHFMRSCLVKLLEVIVEDKIGLKQLCSFLARWEQTLNGLVQALLKQMEYSISCSVVLV